MSRSARILATVTFILMAASPAFAEEKPFTIDDAYRAALADNEIVKIAEEDVSQSEYRVDQAGTFLYPRINGRASYTRYNQTLPPEGGPFLFQPTDSFQGSIVLTQPLYTGGRTLAAFRTAQKLRETSQNSLSIARQDTMIRVAEAYYDVLKAQKTVDISTRSLKRMEHHKQITEREAATRRTKSTQSALLRANSLVTQARIILVRAQDGLKIARDRLRLLTKVSGDVQLIVPPQLEPTTGSLESLQKTALENRDDYTSSQVNKIIAEENVTIVRGGHYPQVSAEAGVQRQYSVPATALDATVFYAGFRLQVPLFEGGLMKAEVSEARSKVRQSELFSAFLRQSIESDVYEAYINLQTVASVLDTAKLSMEYAKGNYDAVEGLFSQGLLSSLSLIDAEQALIVAERELNNASYDREVAILRLNRSIGILGKNTGS